MNDQTVTFSDEDRLKFGGDWGTLQTVPKIHPKLGIPLPGTRSSIHGASAYYRTLFRGDIINKDNPSGVSIENPKGEYNLILWNNDGSNESRRFFMTLKIEKGFKVCKADEWEISPDLREVYEVENDMIVLRGGVNVVERGVVPQYEVLMWRTRARMEQEERKLNVAPSSQVVASKAEGKIGGVLTDKGVSVLPMQIEETPHVYTPD